MLATVKEITNPEQLGKMFELDFNEVNGNFLVSQEDKMFIKTMRKGIHQTERGHYEMPLPLKNIDLKFPNNRDVALHWLMNLKRKLSKHEGKVWFPHHGIAVFIIPKSQEK